MSKIWVTGANGQPVQVETGPVTPQTGIAVEGAGGQPVVVSSAAPAPVAPGLISKGVNAVKGAIDSLKAMFPNAGQTLLTTMAAKSGAKLTAAQAELEKMKLLQQQQAGKPGGGTNWMMYGGIALGVVAAVFFGSKLLKGKR